MRSSRTGSRRCSSPIRPSPSASIACASSIRVGATDSAQLERDARHAIGLRYHEGPFLDLGDDTEIKPGMVFTVEPGLYAAGVGGFRHSDTVAVTDDGSELLTFYPRDPESLTLPAR
ncbi:MAG TPA: M24 family metallopeptidase [Gaiellaceae bacterium]|nr:M24 family metallopeptidase [Gaiellaceae bacterium]